MRSNSEAEPKPKEGCGSSKMLLLMACPKYLEAHHRPVERAWRERRRWVAAVNRLRLNVSRIIPGDWGKVRSGWLA
jgi:hypothetical protein